MKYRETSLGYFTYDTKIRYVTFEIISGASKMFILRILRPIVRDVL